MNLTMISPRSGLRLVIAPLMLFGLLCGQPALGADPVAPPKSAKATKSTKPAKGAKPAAPANAGKAPAPAKKPEPPATPAAPLKVLFLGDEGHHQPRARYAQLVEALKPAGIELTYTDQVSDLNAETLAKFPALVIYANTTELPAAEEAALLKYVEEGGGLVPLHCASYCFLNSDRYIALVGAQFERHGGESFRVEQLPVDHPILAGFGGFESWDETYVHTRHNPVNRTVLEQRGDEPWTWVRTEGQGRVFYTAWGHDQRTWSQPGFINLVERGIRWAARDNTPVASFTDKPQMTPIPEGLAFEYVPADVPFYPESDRWGVQGEQIKQMQSPLAPEESLRHYSTPVGFHVELVAHEPNIGKPIAMTWDHRGRLWLAETVDYPNDMQPEGQGRDSIRILEDSDRDGRVDKSTVFATKLSIPTSLVPAYDGVIVHQAPYTLFLRDKNGDDVADEQHVLLEGWSTDDTHAGPSNLLYGQDGWYYGSVGYAGFQGTVAGEQHRFRQGYYRFKLQRDASGVPSVAKLEFLRSTNNNTWGLGLSETGLLFGSTANGCPSVYMPFPNRVYERLQGRSAPQLEIIAESNRFYPITNKVRQVDHHGGFTSAAGHALYTARAYPPTYWNQTAFVCDPTGHLVSTFLLQQVGTDFRSRNAWNLLASDDEWAAPTMAEVGPDGSVWVIDWYAFIVQHNPTPHGYNTGKGNAYDTPLRDHTHGRVLRVVYDQAAPKDTTWKPLDPNDADQLVATLSHSNMLWRKQAQRLLVETSTPERTAEIAPKLLKVIAADEVDSIGLAAGAQHALATLLQLPGVEAQVRQDALNVAAKSRAPGVRALAAAELASGTGLNLAQAGPQAETSPSVLLAALTALSDAEPSPARAELVANLFREPRVWSDRWLPEALTSAAAGQGTEFLLALAQGSFPVPALGGTETARRTASLTQLGEHFGRTLTGDRSASESQVNAGMSAVAKALSALPPDWTNPLVSGLLKGWPAKADLKLADSDSQQVLEYLKTLPAADQGQFVTLLQRWQTPGLEPYLETLTSGLLERLGDESLDDAVRSQAARELVALLPSSDRPAEAVVNAITARTSPELADELLLSLQQLRSAEVPALTIAHYASWTPRIRQRVLRILIGQREWTGKLLAALEDSTIPLQDVPAELKQSLASHPDAELAARASKLMAAGGGLPNADREQVVEEYAQTVLMGGTAERGHEIFKKQCSKCHQHSGEGVRVGPDLTGMSVHPRRELLTHILDPSRSVEGNFRVYTVALEDGRVVSGMLAGESRTAIELIDTEGKRSAVNRSEIEELVESRKSLMPEGLEKQIPPTDMQDLLAFMTRRGKYVPLPLDRLATIVTTKGMFYASDSEVERLIFNDWSPKTVGEVPFQLINPNGTEVANAIMLRGPIGPIAPTMPETVTLPCGAPLKRVHLLSGVSGWGFPATEAGTVSMIVRFHYEDGSHEDVELRNGVQFADYIRRVDVPGSEFAFDLQGGKQLRVIAVEPTREDPIRSIELVKGPDVTAPVVMAVTLEPR